MKSTALSSLAALLLFFIARAPAALQVSPPLWGFDGKVLNESFNVLSVEIANPGGKPFDGDLVLDDAAGLGARSSAPYKQRVYLAPGSARWVQFYPYVASYVPQWRLSWDGSERGSVDLGQPNSGPPAIVLLADPNSPASRAAKMRLFPENLFPSTVSATDGLHALVLDHQPRWDAQRREAFLDWVNRGGIVHLIPGSDGALPQFTETLAPLNVSGERGNVGAGWVAKHKIPRSEITEQSLKDAGFPPPEIVEYDAKSGSPEGQIFDLDGFTFRKLAAVTKPDIAWGLIYFLTAVYVVLIGPVFYLLRKRDYRLLLGGFIATVVLFAAVFTAVGRRGYGEKQIYHSLAIARSLGAGRFDVREWVHAFATTGDIYRFQHGEGSQLYAALGEGETVRGDIAAGKESSFTADIPLFSSRPFLHRGVEKMDDPGITVVEWDDTSAIPGSLRIRTEAGFRKRAFAAIVSRRRNYAEMAPTTDGFELKRGAARSLNVDFFKQHQFQDYGNNWLGNDSGNKGEIERILRSLHPVFISRVNGEPAYFLKRISSPRPEDDRLRLFVYAEAPPEFAMKNDRFQAGTQLVLYVQDIFKP